MTRQVPSFLGTTLRPEQRREGKGGEGNGPAMRPAEHSLAKALSITLGCV